MIAKALVTYCAQNPPAEWHRSRRSRDIGRKHVVTNFRCMHYTVYVLYSPSTNKIYIGFTSDLEARLKSHNELATKGWTIKFRPWILAYHEKFDSKAEAMKRERELKTAKGRQFIRKEILHQ